jgi:hypothetical protein
VSKIASKIRSGDFSFLCPPVPGQDALPLSPMQKSRRSLSKNYTVQENEADDLEEFQNENFNVLTIRDPRQLRIVSLKIIMDMVDLGNLGISQNVLAEYIRLLAVNYKPIPFHNFYHAVSALHCMYTILKKTRVAECVGPVKTFAFLLSAVTHDVAHPGHSNLFEINSGSELALLYNDDSVLEQHHCALGFRLMFKPGANVLGLLPLSERKDIRKTMIACILATDMAHHGQIMNEAKTRAEVISRRQTFLAADSICLGELFMHAADISGPVKPLDVARAWAALVTEEFNAQYAAEIALGLPVLPFMAAADEETFLNNEIGFSNYVVTPLWRLLSDLFPELEYARCQLEENINQYKVLKDELIVSV